MKRIIIFCNMLILGLALSSNAICAEWYNPAWKYRVLVGCNDPVAGYVMADSPIIVYYDDDTQTDAGEIDCQGFCQTDFDDIVITESDGVTISTVQIVETVDSDHVTLSTHGDGDKYVYFGNLAYDPVNKISFTGLGCSLHGFNTPSGIVTDTSVFVAAMDAGFSPTLTEYDKTTYELLGSQVIGKTADQDMHTAPAIYQTDDGTFHCAYGSHNSNLYYTRTFYGDQYQDTPIDLSTFSETDPNSKITVTASSVIATAIARDETSYVYKDFGTGYFSGDFTAGFDLTYTSSTLGAVCGVFELTNNISDLSSIYTNNYDTIYIDLYNNGSALQFRLIETNNGGYTVDTSNISAGTYKVRVVRDESVGTYGTIYAYLYNPSTLALVDTLSVALHSKQDFRYLFAVNTYNSGAATALTCSSANWMFPAWQVASTVISSAGTYPMFASWDNSGTENMKVFYRGSSSSGGTFHQNYYWKTSTDNGKTWSAATQYLDGSPNLYTYQTDLVMGANGDVFITWEYMYFCGSGQCYDNVYVAWWDQSATTWKSMGGTDLGAVITKAEADSYCEVVTDEGIYGTFHWARIDIDEDSNPAILYQDYDGDETATHKLCFTRWNGSSWETPTVIDASVDPNPSLLGYDYEGMSLLYNYNELIHESGTGATAAYRIYTQNGTDGGLIYNSSDGGANFTSSSFGSGIIININPVQNHTSGVAEIIYNTTDTTYFPINILPYPGGTAKESLYTFYDIFDRYMPGVQLTNTPLWVYNLWQQPVTNVSTQESTIIGGKLKFAAVNGVKQIYTPHNFDTAGWSGYKLHIELPSRSSYNSYTIAYFGFVKTQEVFDDSLYVVVDTSGTKADVICKIGNSTVISDADNDISADDFDIYVLKDAGGDQITIKNNGGATTVYSGTIPSSGQMDDQINLLLIGKGSWGTSSDVYFDNIYLSPWSTTAPTWDAAGSLDTLTTAAALMGFF